MTENELKKDFMRVFNEPMEQMFFAPGRINLIGEHIDYHGGLVLPASISMGTYALVSKRQDNIINFYSKNFEEDGIISKKLPIGDYKTMDMWTNYPKGVIKILENNGYNINKGLNIYYYGNIPNSSGLSSSASLEVVTAWMLREIFKFKFDKKKAALYSQQAENEYIGVQCGIMDQFAVAMGKENSAILLNTNTLYYDYAPMKMEKYSFLIMNTNKKRGLEDSDYNKRRKESEEAFEVLKNHYSVDYLADFGPDSLDEIEDIIEDSKLFNRAKHVIMENDRTKKSFQLLKENDLISFGHKLNESHESLKTLYEVTGKELDTIVSAAQRIEGVLGARMVGAGFGGCAIALIEDKHIESAKTEICNEYYNKIGYRPDFYIAHIVDGVHEIK